MENVDLAAGPELTRDPLLDTVIDFLEDEGYDAVQLREVARRARISLSTIYKRYATREELIAAAIERWMIENHSGLVNHTRGPNEPLHPAIMRVMGSIFEPWEKHPTMLFAYFQVRTVVGDRDLGMDSFDPVIRIGRSVMSDVDPEFVTELQSILSAVVYGLVGRCRENQIAISDIMPTIDRTVFLLTTGYQASHNNETAGTERPPASATR